jgi:uncharacterized protein
MAMQLDLSRLRDGVVKIDRRLDPAEFAGIEDFRVTTPVVLTGELRKDGEKVRVKGHLAAALECTCSRCLEAFPVPVALDLDLLFLPVSAAVGGTETGDGSDGEGGSAVADDDLGVSFYKEDALEISDIIREQFYLALPMKPLCRPDCQGLCPVCGVNRNRETCGCRIEWVDPRLEPLRKLRRE